MKRQGYIALLILLLTACHGWRPRNVLSPDDMEDVLFDLHLTEASIRTLYPEMSFEQQQVSFLRVLEAHGLDTVQYNRSLEWYGEHPMQLRNIYDSLQQRARLLGQDVEAYRFHPELTALHQLDTLNCIALYHFRSHYRFTACPVADSVAFSIDNPDFFAPGDKYVWRFYMHAMTYDTVHFDTLHHTTVRFCITYHNGHTDTLHAPIPANGRRYRFTFTQSVPDTLVPVRVYGSFFDGTDSLHWLVIDSATLLRYYNEMRYPLSEAARNQLVANDSVWGDDAHTAPLPASAKPVVSGVPTELTPNVQSNGKPLIRHLPSSIYKKNIIPQSQPHSAPRRRPQ